MNLGNNTNLIDTGVEVIFHGEKHPALCSEPRKHERSVKDHFLFNYENEFHFGP